MSENQVLEVPPLESKAVAFVDVPLTSAQRAQEATKRIQALSNAVAAASRCEALCGNQSGYGAKIVEMANALLHLIQNSYL